MSLANDKVVRIATNNWPELQLRVDHLDLQDKIKLAWQTTTTTLRKRTMFAKVGLHKDHIATWTTTTSNNGTHETRMATQNEIQIYFRIVQMDYWIYFIACQVALAATGSAAAEAHHENQYKLAWKNETKESLEAKQIAMEKVGDKAGVVVVVVFALAQHAHSLIVHVFNGSLTANFCKLNHALGWLWKKPIHNV